MIRATIVLTGAVALLTGGAAGQVKSDTPVETASAVHRIFFNRLTDAGIELWRTDGTVGGASLVKDINAGAGDSYPLNLRNVGGKLFFSAFDPLKGNELWRTNGTDTGTARVSDIYPGSTGSLSYPYSEFVGVGSTLFFTANDGAHGPEVWASNGTSTGTHLVKDIYPGASTPFAGGPQQLVNANGTLFFRAVDSSGGQRLFKSNGTTNGTIPLSPIGVSSGHAHVGGTLFFETYDSGHGHELWKSTGTPGGTGLVKDINPGPGSGFPSYLTESNSRLLFTANDGKHGPGLWKSNGTAAGTVMVKDIAPSSAVPGHLCGFPVGIADVNGTLFFGAYTSANGIELWKSNGTAAGTSLVKDINPAAVAICAGSSFPENLFNLNGILFFAADDGVHGRELWRSDGTPAGTKIVKDLNPGAGNSAPSNFTADNGALFFVASHRNNVASLWRSDGTAVGTVRLETIEAASAAQNRMFLTRIGNILFFSALDRAHGQELWKSNGAGPGTSLLKDLPGGEPDPLGLYIPGPQQFTDVGGAAFFVTKVVQNDPTGLAVGELWTSDGTAAGTHLVKGFGAASQGIEELTAVNGELFFAGKNSTYGAELWISDGTPTGTKLVKNIKPGAGSGLQENHRFGLGYTLTSVGNQLFFAADNGVKGFELWKSNGTATGTTLVKDINPGANGSSPTDLTDVNGALYFRAYNGTTQALWRSNGSAAGTVKLKDLDPVELTNVDGTLFFSAGELWKSDGTPNGTAIVKDIRPSFDSNPYSLTAVGTKLFFVADDGTHGQELWVSNGAGTGTVLVKDIHSVRVFHRFCTSPGVA